MLEDLAKIKKYSQKHGNEIRHQCENNKNILKRIVNIFIKFYLDNISLKELW